MSKLEEEKTIKKPSEEKVWEKYFSDEAKNFDFPKVNVYDAVYEENKNRKDCIALEYEGTEIPFGEFFDRVDERTEFFKNCGIKEDDIVTVSMLLSPDFVYSWYALSRLNAVSNLIDPRTSVEGIKEYIDEAGSKYILNTSLFTPNIIKAIEKGENFKIINYSLGNYAEKIAGPFGIVSELLTLYSKQLEKKDKRIDNCDETHNKVKLDKDLLPEYKSNKPLTIVHTGGTTGIPKGVVLSHDNYNAMAYEYKKSGVGFEPNDRFLLIMPPWISYGSGMLHMNLITGMKADILSKPNSKKMDRYILKHEPQWFAGVPAHIGIVSNSKRFQNADKPYLKGGAVGGGALSPKLYESASKQFRVDPGYGFTEGSSAFAVKRPGKYKVGSVGFPLPGGTMGAFKFDEETGTTFDEELGYNQIGEICVRTPNMMLGYFKNEKETEKVLRKHKDGNVWIHTGDLGYIDEDGFLFITDRIKEMITRYDGFKIYPSLMEKVINSCDGVSSCKVVGVDDTINNHGQVPMAFVVLKQGSNKSNDIFNDIKKKCKQVLPAYYNENLSIEEIEKLPLTNLGKVDFRKLSEIGNSKKAENKLGKKLKKIFM